MKKPKTRGGDKMSAKYRSEADMFSLCVNANIYYLALKTKRSWGWWERR